jgi:hypothetical protein
MYIGYIQFFLIGVVFLEQFREKPWGEFIFKYAMISIPVFLLLFIIISLVLGFIDTRLGFREEELRNASTSNPVTREILDNLEEIKEELREIKEGKQA